MIILLVLMAIFAPLIAPYRSDHGYLYAANAAHRPEPGHPFGYDHVTRDLFSRVIFGSRVALTVGIVATTISVTIGVIIGALAGYFGGWVDNILSRVIDTLMAFPIMALLIVLAAVLGPSLSTTIIVIGVTVWARYARVVRADMMSLRQRDYVLAARSIGVKDWRIIWRHTLPNVLGPGDRAGVAGRRQHHHPGGCALVSRSGRASRRHRRGAAFCPMAAPIFCAFPTSPSFPAS